MLKHRKKKSFSLLFTILLVVLIAYCVVLTLLILWGFLTSLRDNMGFIESPFSFKGGIHFKENYEIVIDNFKEPLQKEGGGYRTVYIEHMFLYSIEYAVGCSLINTFVTCVCAYVAARFKLKISAILYSIVLVVMALPIVGNLPAEVSMAKSLGIYGTMWGMYIMRAAFIGPYFLVFAAMYKGLPKDFSEAAYIDGASEFTIFFKIMFPMSLDTFFTIMLLSFIGYWNDYSIPLIYLPEHPPLALGLYKFTQSTNNVTSAVPVKMAGCYTVLLPILIIFVIFQNKLMGNVSMGGLKE